MIYDIIGVGYGPANLALAIALEERVDTPLALYLEEQPDPGWHPHMMLPGADIQHH
ncbi:MAG: SidA/IucD/PvdA family monooxygenase, partial [Nocardioides sp.]